MNLRSAVGLLACAMFLLPSARGDTNVRSVGLRGDGITDDTDALKKALGDGGVTLTFPPGLYLLGTVDVPGNVVLHGEKGAKIRVNPARLRPYGAGPMAKPGTQCLFALRGSRIELSGFEFEFALTEDEKIAAEKRPDALIYGENCAGVRLLGLAAERPEPAAPLPPEQRPARGISSGRYPALPPNRRDFHLASFRTSQDLLLRDCRARFINCMINVQGCSGITSENNRAENGYAITRANLGDRFIRHTGNWSREVQHQCRWWGGDANDRHGLKPGDPGWDTATVVKRLTRETDPGFNEYTAGAYDIIVSNNYAEYGKTLAWGSKGRQIIFENNIARFMTDYALGSEGGENVVFDGNIVINSFTAGLVVMYWSEKVIMKGNTVLVRDEPINPKLSWYATPAPYQGGLIRLHSTGGPADRSGAGQVVISNNLFSSELDDGPRRIGVEAGRDVLITGNKIRNGSINVKPGAGQVLVSDNDFVMTAPHDGAWVTVSGSAQESILRNNVIHNTRPLDRRSPTEVMFCVETDGSPASRLRIIDGNQIEGFPLAIWGRAFAGKEPARFIVRNNATDGVIRFEGTNATARVAIDGNVNLATLAPLAPQILSQLPRPLPSPVPTVQDEADAASGGSTPAPAAVALKPKPPTTAMPAPSRTP